MLLLFLALFVASPVLVKLSKDQCSAENQPPCPAAHYKAPVCDRGLGNFDGICKKGKGYEIREASPRELKRVGPDMLPAVSGEVEQASPALL